MGSREEEKCEGGNIRGWEEKKQGRDKKRRGKRKESGKIRNEGMEGEKQEKTTRKEERVKIK